MHQRARIMGRLLAIAWAACLGLRAAVADFPDYAPTPPGAEGNRTLPAAIAPLEGELNQPSEPDRFGASRAGEPAQFGDPSQRGTLPPRPLAVGLQPTDQPLDVTSGPFSGVRAASQNAPLGDPPITLMPPSSAARSPANAAGAGPLVTGVSSLAIVLGLFLLVAWVVRRGMPKGAAILPSEAVEVLGRVPLVGRQNVHLIRCGNKILLVCVSPSSVETLTEITDPEEVDRLAEICQQMHPLSVTASFGQALGKIGKRHVLDYAQDAATEFDFGQLDPTSRRRHEESRA